MRKAKKSFIILLLIYSLAFGGITFGGITPNILLADENPTGVTHVIARPLPPILESELALVVDPITGIILHSHGNPHQRAFPASMTKVMTALLLLESGAAMDDKIFHSYEAVFTVPRDSSRIAMNPGESLTVLQALYAIMLRSCNEVSNAIAEFVAGDMASFALLMTRRAHELGAVNTNFTNAHGLPHPDNYTTPYDMYLIMRQAITFDVFLEVAGTARFLIPPTEMQPEPRVLDNTNLMVRPTSPEFTLDIAAGKTGWTTVSGHTLVSYGRRQEEEWGSHAGLITVIMEANRREAIFNDTRALMNFGFSLFEEQTLFSEQDFSSQRFSSQRFSSQGFSSQYAEGSFQNSIELIQRGPFGVAILDTLPLRLARDVKMLLPDMVNFEVLEIEISLPNRIVAPVPAGFAAGRVVLSYNGRVLDVVEIVTAAEGVAVLSAGAAGGRALRVPTETNPHYVLDLPDWMGWLNHLNEPNTITFALAGVGSSIIITLMARFLKFAKKKRSPVIKGYSTKSLKMNLSKNYKYR